MINVICSLLHVFLFVCGRVLGALLCVRAWRTGLRLGRICWQEFDLNFSRFLVCSFLFFRCLSLMFRFISCSRSLCALWFASSPSSRSSAFSAGGRDGGPARVFATSSRLRTSGPRARMRAQSGVVGCYKRFCKCTITVRQIKLLLLLLLLLRLLTLLRAIPTN